MFIAYNIIFACAFVLASPYLLLKVIFQERYREGIWERLGFIPKDKLKKLFGRQVLWFHAVSIGEANAIYPLYQAFKKKYPSVTVCFSTTTKTGQRWIQPKLNSEDIAIYYPIDLYWSVGRVLAKVRPDAFIAVETEIWPNFWWQTYRLNIPLGIVNGRLSKNSFKGYLKIAFVMKKLLHKLSIITVQTEDDAARFLKLGAPKKNLLISGNLKYEASMSDDGLKEKTENIKRQLQIGNERILMGGSTHAGEDEALFECYQKLAEKDPSVRLLLAPRRPERCLQVKQLIERKGYQCILESEQPYPRWKANHVFLIDRMGKLPLYYALATVVFIGKSLTAHGGQNLLEPAALGKVVLFGPHMENFRSIADSFLKEKAAFEVQSPEDLYQAVERVLSSDVLRVEMQQKAKWMVEKNKGAVSLVLKEIERQVSWLH